MTSHKRSANERAESGQQTGPGDGLIDLMRYAGVPITRQNYLELAYMCAKCRTS
jgi:hypothetical protein